MFGFGKNIDPGVFWSSHYKTDAHTLLKTIKADTKKVFRFLEAEINKLDYVGGAIDEGRTVIRNTVCSKCKEELIKKTKRHQTREETETRKKHWTIPPEKWSLINDITSLVIQNEKLKNKTADDEEYITLEDYYEKELFEMKEKHETELQSINNNISQMEKEIQQLTMQLQDKTREVKTWEETIDEQKKKYEGEAKIKIDALKMSAESKENAYMKLKEELSTSEGYAEDLQQQVKGLEQELDQLLKENDKLNSLVDTLSKEQQKQRSNSGNNDEIRNFQKGRDNMDIMMKSTQQENERIQRLQKQAKKLEDERKDMSSKYEKLQGNYTTIKRDLSTKHEEANSIRRDKDKVSTDLQTLKEKKYSLEKDLRTEIETLKDETALISSKVYESRQDIEKMRKELDLRDEELNRKRIKMETLSNDNETIHEQMKLLRMENTGMSSDLDVLRKSDVNLRAEICSKCEEIDKLSKNLETTEHEKQILRQKMNNLMQENEDMYSKVQTSGQEIEQAKRELFIKDEDIRKMRTELRNAKKKTLVMVLRSDRSGMGKTMVDMITRELKRRLRDRLDRENIELTIRPCQTLSDIPNGPLVLPCLNMSRVGTNIQDALEGVKATKDVFVLVLHNTSKENLSLLTPTSLRVTGSELRQLGGIYDMAFDNGLYECDLNDSAMEKMFHILMKY